MAANDAANVDPSRPASEALSDSLVREMAAAADQFADIETPNGVTARAIAHCAELLSRYWPADANGESAYGRSPCNGESSASSPPSHSADATECEAGANRIGRFEIRRGLGHGGFGVVFLVFDPRLNREVALKIPRPEIMVSSSLRQRFLREARVAAVLDHPNIVPIYETGEVGPVGYILSGYCKGPTLASWLRDQPGPISPRVATEIVVELADAVHHAHSRGILHRDIKPANVLLEPAADTRPGDRPFIPRLSDFGLAKRLNEATGDTQVGAIVGTPQYMAPEQAAGDDRQIGVQTDVYGLGAILFELLTHEPPIVGTTDSETLQKIQSQEVSPTVLRARRVPRDLETICLKCLQKKPADRYQSARELSDDLRRFLSGEAVHARPLSNRERLVRWCRRRPVVAGLSAALMAAIVAGSSMATWQWRRAERNYAEARTLLYSANMKLADAAWQQGNIGAIERLIEPFADGDAGPHDLRGWEWYFFRRVCQQDPSTKYGRGQVQALAQSPDGQTILVASKENEVWAYDLKSGKKHWTATGLAIRYVVCATFDSSCEHLGTVDGSGRVLVWRLRPEPKLVCDASLGYEPTAAAFDRTLSNAVVASPDAKLHIWNVNEHRDVGTLEGHTAKVISVTFSANEDFALTGGEDSTVRLWDLNQKKAVRIVEHPRKAHIRVVAISPDGQFFAAGADDNAAVVWQREEPQPVADLNGHANYIETLAFNDASTYLASGGEDRTIRIWELPAGKLKRTLRGHLEPVSQVAFVRGSNVLISGGADGSVKTWNPDTEDFAQPNPRLQVTPIALFAADGTRLLCQGLDGQLTLYQMPDWKKLRTIAGPMVRTALAYDSIRDRIAVSQHDGVIQLWQGTNNERSLAGHVGFVESLAFSPNGQWLASGGDDQTVRIWDVSTGEQLHDIGSQPRRVHSVTFSPDSKQLAWSTDNLVRIGDPATGDLIRTQHGHSERVYNVAYSPAGDHLASGDRFGTIIVWDAVSGDELRRLIGHTDRAYTTCFTPDGTRLVSCSRDGTIRWWDLAAGRELLAVRGDWGPLEWISVSPDGWTLIAIEKLGDLRVWDPRLKDAR